MTWTNELSYQNHFVSLKNEHYCRGRMLLMKEINDKDSLHIFTFYSLYILVLLENIAFTNRNRVIYGTELRAKFLVFLGFLK